MIKVEYFCTYDNDNLYDLIKDINDFIERNEITDVISLSHSSYIAGSLYSPSYSAILVYKEEHNG